VREVNTEGETHSLKTAFNRRAIDNRKILIKMGTDCVSPTREEGAKKPSIQKKRSRTRKEEGNHRKRESTIGPLQGQKESRPPREEPRKDMSAQITSKKKENHMISLNSGKKERKNSSRRPSKKQQKRKKNQKQNNSQPSKETRSLIKEKKKERKSGKNAQSENTHLAGHTPELEISAPREE